MFDTLQRWVRQAQSTVKALDANFAWDPKSRETIPLALARWAEESPSDPFVHFEGRWWNVGEFDGKTNRLARLWADRGLRRGDVVAVMMGNHIDYLLNFYALAKLGVVVALINPALRDAALEHAIGSSRARAVLVDDESEATLAAAGWAQAGPPRERADSLHRHASDFEASTLPSVEHLRLGDVAAYIYTSGTTGLPKPAIVKHHRLWRGGAVFGGMIQLTRDDTLYCCLPLYHANASVIAAPVAITHRARFALAPRFSASRFWRECAEVEATAFIYVGELLRYLVNRDPGSDEREHGVTKILGNGLSSDLWPTVRERFGIERIGEYYAATEGNAETMNLFNRDARMGPMLPWKMAVVRWDSSTEDIERDANGRGHRTLPDEPGLLIGKISARNEYAGYTDEKASKRKVLRDVFKRGDAWFNTGDLVSYDKLLHLRFVDRLGDTFRWKSENVSTTEVCASLNEYPGVLEACVYGVNVPGHEGRAGMAALVVDGELDEEAFFAHVAARMPRYAMPRFLRRVDSLEVTGTFKLRKQSLQREGFTDRGTDTLWIWDSAAARYRRLDEAPTPDELAAL